MLTKSRNVAMRAGVETMFGIFSAGRSQSTTNSATPTAVAFTSVLETLEASPRTIMINGQKAARKNIGLERESTQAVSQEHVASKADTSPPLKCTGPNPTRGLVVVKTTLTRTNQRASVSNTSASDVVAANVVSVAPPRTFRGNSRWGSTNSDVGGEGIDRAEK